VKLKRIAFLYLLAAISIIFLLADFFHTETTLEEQDDCPICIFERNSLAISQLYFLFVEIVFVSLFRFIIHQNRARSILINFHFNIRAPPSCLGT
jgi:hypothetical protein